MLLEEVHESSNAPLKQAAQMTALQSTDNRHDFSADIEVYYIRGVLQWRKTRLHAQESNQKKVDCDFANKERKG